MTTHIVIAIRDQKLDAYGRPYCSPTTAAAVRSFYDEAENQQSEIYKHPGDYELVQLGTYDDTTGKFTNLDQPKQLAIGQERN